MQHWQSPSDAVVKCKWNKLHFIAHKKLIASAVCIVYFVLAKRQALIRSKNRCMHERRNNSRHVGLEEDDQRLHKADKSICFTLTYPVFVSLKITHQQAGHTCKLPSGCWLYWPISQRSATFRGYKSIVFGQRFTRNLLYKKYLQVPNHSASCTVASECTLLIMLC